MQYEYVLFIFTSYTHTNISRFGAFGTWNTIVVALTEFSLDSMCVHFPFLSILFIFIYKYFFKCITLGRVTCGTVQMSVPVERTICTTLTHIFQVYGSCLPLLLIFSPWCLVLSHMKLASGKPVAKIDVLFTFVFRQTSLCIDTASLLDCGASFLL